MDLNIAADTTIAIPDLTNQVRELLGQRSDRADVLQRREARVTEARNATRKRWDEERQKEMGKNPQ